MFNLIVVILAIILTVGLALVTMNYVAVDETLNATDARVVAGGLQNFVAAGRLVEQRGAPLPTSIGDLHSMTGIGIPPLPKNAQWVLTSDAAAGVARVCVVFPGTAVEMAAMLEQIGRGFSEDALVGAEGCGEVTRGQAAVGVIIIPARH